jgi:hypothetical protein
VGQQGMSGIGESPEKEEEKMEEWGESVCAIKRWWRD